MLAESKPLLDKVVPNNSEMEVMVATQIARTTAQMLSKDSSALATESLDDILQCPYEIIRTGVCSAIHNVVQKVLLFS